MEESKFMCMYVSMYVCIYVYGHCMFRNGKLRMLLNVAASECCALEPEVRPRPPLVRWGLLGGPVYFVANY